VIRRVLRGLRFAAPLVLSLALLFPAAITAQPAAAAGSATTLVLYDTTSEYGWMGEAYATQIANLAGRFGTYKALPASKYTAGLVNSYTATVYIGSTYDEPIAPAFLADAKATTKPVVWLLNNIWQLGAWNDDFALDYGWRITGYSPLTVASVAYKGQSLTRHANAGQIMGVSVTDPAKATVLATASNADGSATSPWAVRSKNLTYIADEPLSYMSENDRYLILADLLFDALAPDTVERHRALVRLEDIGPKEDPAEFKAVVDLLVQQKVPFSFGVYPLYKDPNGTYNGGVPETVRLKDSPEVVKVIKYAISKGGVMLMHGWTHQYSNKANPYGGTSGDDFEFYLAHEDAVTGSVIYDGPVPEDSTKWALSRVDGSVNDFKAAGLAVPTIFEFPHYAASAIDYQAIRTRFTTRYERSLYPVGVLTGRTPDNSHVVGQFFPYPVTDVYGSKVIPENIGNYEAEWYNNHPPRFPADMIASAKRNLVIRDGYASLFYHPFNGTAPLAETIKGIKALGYTFVSPTSV
jgi:uncharacterized protein YdaL